MEKRLQIFALEGQPEALRFGAGRRHGEAAVENIEEALYQISQQDC